MISQNELSQIADYLDENPIDEFQIRQLRSQYTDKHFTWCMEDDITGGTPVMERPGFSIYAVNSSDHCSVLTNDLAAASGLVIAEIIED
ncbi:MAG: DUF6129 family protein [Pseudomonadota bacterium]